MNRNQIVIDGRLSKLSALRHTPAGTPAIDLMIVHNSVQREAGRPRQVQCELEAVALGEAAVSASKLKRNQELRVSGFLARRSAGDRQLVLHVIGTETIEDSHSKQTQEPRRTQ